MPTTPTYPGVYVEELPSGLHTITGVATAVAVFVDFFPRGPLNQPVQILSMSDFEREFGGMDTRSEAGYGISQFFLNGGAEAWVIRAASAPLAKANVAVKKGTLAADPTALLVDAINEGNWGNTIRLRVDPSGSGQFNLTLSEVRKQGNRSLVVREEVFRNLSMDSSKTNFVKAVVNDPLTGSKLARVSPSGNAAPLTNGTISDLHATDPTITKATSTVVTGTESKMTLKLNLTIADGAISTSQVLSLTVTVPTATPAVSLPVVAPLLQAAIRAARPDDQRFASANVDLVGAAGSQQLLVRVGGAPINLATFANVATDITADELKLTTAKGATVNLQQYMLGDGDGTVSTPATGVANTASGAAVKGNDGLPPTGADLVAALDGLSQIDLFNLLCIPRTALVQPVVADGLTATEAQMVTTVAINRCEVRRALFLMDTPQGVRDYNAIKNWMAANDTLRSKSAALYYPRVKVADPLNNFRARDIGASGSIAGLMSRTDTARGLWKAPAGTDAALKGVLDLDDVLTDQRNGVLNPLAINCIRKFPVYGNVVWGARTLAGSDQAASDWKYVSVRRLADYIEESLFRGSKWVVFEPNDEPLWAQVRLNLGAFMHNLFRQGAFQGKTPQEAYFVKCDRETTTQEQINQGMVNIVVGFAPLKPAEFVILKLQQMAGQLIG